MSDSYRCPRVKGKTSGAIKIKFCNCIYYFFLVIKSLQTYRKTKQCQNESRGTKMYMYLYSMINGYFIVLFSFFALDNA